MAGSDQVTVILKGVVWEGWLSFEISNDFEEMTGEASLVISEQPGNPLPADIGDTAQILLAGQSVINGFIKNVEGEITDQSHTINYTIKDKTDDLIKSTIGPDLKIKPPTTLKQVAEKTVKHMGLDVKVIDKVNPPPFKQGEVVVSDITDRGSKFLDSWVRKRNAVFNTDGNGDLVINQNQKQLSSYALHSGPEDDPANNILSSKYSNSEEGRSNEYAASGQKSPNDKEFWESRPKGDPLGAADAMATNWGKAHDTAIRPQLKLHFRGKRGMQGGTPKEAAQWAANVNRARNFKYSCTVAGFTQGPGGALWWPGLLVPIYDFHWNIDHTLFLKTVSFKKDGDGGAIADLSFTVEDAYSPQAEPDGAQSRSKKRPLGASEKGRFNPDYFSNKYDGDTGVRRIKGR